MAKALQSAGEKVTIISTSLGAEGKVATDTWLDTAARTRQAVTTASATFEQLHAWLLPLAEPPC